MEAAAHGEDKEKPGQTPIKSAQLCAWLDSPRHSWLGVFLDNFFKLDIKRQDELSRMLKARQSCAEPVGISLFICVGNIPGPCRANDVVLGHES